MRPRLLLDTCAAIWIARGEGLSDAGVATLAEALEAGDDVWMSPVTAWEVGLLAARGRLQLAMRPDDWFDDLVGTEGLGLAPTPPRVLVESSFLPGQPPNDPADRVMIATAREHGAVLLTRDRQLLAYGAAGHMRVAAC